MPIARPPARRKSLRNGKNEPLPLMLGIDEYELVERFQISWDEMAVRNKHCEPKSMESAVMRT